jgi:hypothetical protein
MDQQRLQAQAQAEFREALNHIGFNPVEQQAIIDFTGCTNLAMIGLLLEDDIIKICKTLWTAAEPCTAYFIARKTFIRAPVLDCRSSMPPIIH